MTIKRKESKRKENIRVFCKECKINWKELSPPGMYCTECRLKKAEEARERQDAFKKNLYK